jgi:hypothetical protein
VFHGYGGRFDPDKCNHISMYYDLRDYPHTVDWLETLPGVALRAALASSV